MNGIELLHVAADRESPPAGLRAGVGRAARRARPWALRRTSMLVGISLLVFIVGACILAPVLSPYGTNEIVGPPYAAPSAEHPFGTDSVGRDMLVRVFVAGRLDIALALIIVAAALAIGTVVGTLAGGARRRWVDTGLMRLVDAVIAFPFLVLVLVLVVVLGPERTLGPLPAGALAVAVGVILGDWAFYARLARGQTLALRERDYVVAARVLGFSQVRIVLRHLLPGVVGTVAAYAVADAILVMITVASLSFVGVGIQPPTPEWGALMYEGRAVLQDAWWITVIPGVMLALSGLAFSLVADGLLSDREERR
jgi:peptide/nickel transport system permease protein